ncbi:MAG: hypothetical protein ACHQX0_06250 [Desulfobaccales bacterium]
MSQELYRIMENRIRISKHRNLEQPEAAIRLYCSQYGTVWNLQVRDFVDLGRGSGGKGMDFIIAAASLHRADLQALRDACDAELRALGEPG